MEGERRRTPTLLDPLGRAGLHHWTFLSSEILKAASFSYPIGLHFTAG
jgi:hypothetical protein